MTLDWTRDRRKQIADVFVFCAMEFKGSASGDEGSKPNILTNVYLTSLVPASED